MPRLCRHEHAGRFYRKMLLLIRRGLNSEFIQKFRMSICVRFARATFYILFSIIIIVISFFLDFINFFIFIKYILLTASLSDYCTGFSSIFLPLYINVYSIWIFNRVGCAGVRIQEKQLLQGSQGVAKEGMAWIPPDIFT